MRFIVSLFVFLGLSGAVWFSLTDEEKARLIAAAQQRTASTSADTAVVDSVEAVDPLRMEYSMQPMQCVPRTVKAERASKRGVYRWKDENGRWHYGDTPPGSMAAEDLSTRFPGQVRHVTVRLEGNGTGAALRDGVNADAERIFGFYARYLPEAAKRNIAIKINTFTDPDAFAQWRNQRDQASDANAGIYDVLEREAAVLLSGDPDWDAGVIRHEMTHAIHYELLARPPVWFDEGMAEVFNTLSYRNGHWQAAGWRVPHIARLAGTSGDAIVDELNRTDWPGDDPALSYARAWSMAAFLLSAPDDSVFVKYLQWLASHYCKPVDSRAFMAGHYPGGLVQWQSDWEAWVQVQASGSAVWWQRIAQE